MLGQPRHALFWTGVGSELNVRQGTTLLGAGVPDSVTMADSPAVCGMGGQCLWGSPLPSRLAPLVPPLPLVCLGVWGGEFVSLPESLFHGGGGGWG